uniref:Uncharacterized protein n=1 Tax=Kwoniella pini CBS 10737 TaxID=1296096 RepID=A0A1B9HUP6_9TREE|nr:uncharacterized protein I206_06763 [Kwoniella pini CBS 10737]OCF46989.1 hypothetical protein I206_06763 [Kwoniella pini CBS 10737]
MNSASTLKEEIDFEGVRIQSKPNGKCLRPMGQTLINGSEVQSVLCDSGSRWNLSLGITDIFL